MAEWSQRLQRLQATLPRPELESLDHLTIADLKDEKISFGQAHLGKRFEEVWTNAPDWTKWFLQHYSGSSKMEHRRVIKYIQLKIEEAESNPASLQAPLRPVAKAQAKVMMAKAKARPAAIERSEVNMEILESMEPEVPWPSTEESQQMVHGLNVRMVNLENALHQILEHLSPPSTTAGTMPAESLPIIPSVEEWDDPWNP